MAVAIVALAASFAVPHARTYDTATPPAARWLGRLDGGARLVRVVEADESITWTSSTSEELPDLSLLSLDDGFSEAIFERAGERRTASYRSDGRVPDTTIVREHVVERSTDEGPRARTNVLVLDEQGYGLVGSLDEEGAPEVFHPPLPLLPADPLLGSTWESAGTYGGGIADYRFTGEVTADRLRATAVGGERFCLLVETHLSLVQAEETIYEQRGQEWWCDGLGPESFEADAGDGARRGELVGADGLLPVRLPPPLPSDGDVLDLGAPELGGAPARPWTRTSVREVPSGVVTPRPTAVPTLVGSPPGALLVATMGDPVLRALSSTPDARAAARWTVATGSTSFGAPAVDRDRQMIVAGSARGEVRALTLDGLLRWSTDVGDNVATRPLITDDVIVVGSEDGSIVGLETTTGRIRWRVRTGGPVVSWPAALGALAVIGSDDGLVRAVDPTDGTVAWTHDLGMPVEAPIAPVGDGVVAVGREGDAVRLEADGSVRWAATTAGTVTTSPVISGGAVVAVASGSLVALDAEDGSLRWEQRGTYVGPPVALRGAATVAAATSSGEVAAFDGEGVVVERWPALREAGGRERRSSISIGPAAGAGALWLVDDEGLVQRIGPTEEGTAEERVPSWALPVGSEPMGTSLLQASPLVLGDDVVLIDAQGSVVSVDPEDGSARAEGTIDVADGSIKVTPAVAGDVAFVAAGSAVIAVRLPEVEARWKRSVPGLIVRPPIVADGSVLVASEEDDVHHLSALDRETGEVRWQRTTGTAAVPFATMSPLLVAGDLVVAGDPVAARSIDDGELRWETDADLALGGAVATDRGIVVSSLAGIDPGAPPVTVLVTLDPEDGRTLERSVVDGVFADGYVPLILLDDGSVVLSDASEDRLVAVDPSTGSRRWEVLLPGQRAGGAALLPDGLLWLTLADGRLLAVDPVEGQVAVRTQALVDDLAGSAISQVPVAAGGVVVASAGMVAIAVRGGTP